MLILRRVHLKTRFSRGKFTALACGLVCAILVTHRTIAYAEQELESASQLSLLKSEKYEALEKLLNDLQARYESSAISDRELYRGFRPLYESSEKSEQYFNEWIRQYPKSYAARVSRGAYYFRMAVERRGAEFVAETPASNLTEMSRYLALSRQDLNQSLDMTRKPYLSVFYQLNTSWYDGSVISRRKWLDYGNNIAPDNYFIRLYYMLSLRPRWGGSYDLMEAFLKECENQHLPRRTINMLKATIDEDKADLAAQNKYFLAAVNFSKLTINSIREAGEEPTMEQEENLARWALKLNAYDDAAPALQQLANKNTEKAWVYAQLAQYYTNKRKLDQAWEMFNKGANLNDPWCQFIFGRTLYRGFPETHLAADQDAGVRWLKKASASGSAEARTFLLQIGEIP